MPKLIDDKAKRTWSGYLSDAAVTMEQEPLTNELIRSQLEKLKGKRLDPDGGTSQAVIVGTRDDRVELELPGGKLHSFPFSEIIHADNVLKYWIGKGKASISQDFRKPDPSIGVPAIGNNSYAPTLADYIRREQLGLDIRFGIKPKGHATLVEDMKSIEDQEVDATTKKALVDARIGQGRFRSQVLELWENQCAVTGSHTQEGIRASHIKPWRKSKHEERLDPNNGLPLIANLDALFDVGLITFDSSGRLIVSSRLDSIERELFGVDERSLFREPSAEIAAFLSYHRENLFVE